MTTFSLWLPFPPSVNNLFAHGSRGGKVRRFPTKAYKAWRFEAVIRIKSARNKQQYCWPFPGPVECAIDLLTPDNRRRDADNYSKAILDALVDAGVLRDDSQIIKLQVLKSRAATGAAAGAVVHLIEPAASTGQTLNLRFEGAA